MNWDYISQKTSFFIVTAVKTSNRTWNYPCGLYSGDFMFPVKYELGFLSQKMAFFIITAMETSDLT
jgi:hypothetical protein